MNKEAQLLINFYKYVGILGKPISGELRRQLYMYAINVNDKEFKEMQDGKQPHGAWLYLQNADEILLNYKPNGLQQTLVFENSLKNYDQLTLARKDRILIASNSLDNLLYVILITVSIFMILCLCMYTIKNISFHIFTILMVIFTVSLLISITKYLDSPFRGDIRVKKTSIQYCIHRMQEINKLHLERHNDSILE
jgi:hypothetical protein